MSVATCPSGKRFICVLSYDGRGKSPSLQIMTISQTESKVLHVAEVVTEKSGFGRVGWWENLSCIRAELA